MKHRLLFVFLLSFLNFFQLCSHLPQQTAQTTKKKLSLRVLLNKTETTHIQQVQLNSPTGFLVTNGAGKPTHLAESRLTLSAQGKQFGIRTDDRKIRKKSILKLGATHGAIEYEGKQYTGSLLFVHDEKTNNMLVINQLDIEDYVYAVLPFEIYQSWPHEMQKVQAIATRTYALYLLNQNRNRMTQQRRKPYDLVCSNLHQTYNGDHNHQHVRSAVKQTRGTILSFDGKPIIAMFDACCGGAVPADIDQHDYNKAPYLARKHRCTFCKNSSLYTWEKKIELDTFIEHLKKDEKIAKHLAFIGRPTNVRVAQKDKAGLITKLQIRGTERMLSVARSTLYEKMRTFFKSLHFSLSCKDDTVHVKGNGYGHQVGLCQHGARELVRQGWQYADILKFYYPNTKLSRVAYA